MLGAGGHLGPLRGGGEVCPHGEPLTYTVEVEIPGRGVDQPVEHQRPARRGVPQRLPGPGRPARTARGLGAGIAVVSRVVGGLVRGRGDEIGRRPARVGGLHGAADALIGREIVGVRPGVLVPGHPFGVGGVEHRVAEGPHRVAEDQPALPAVPPLDDGRLRHDPERLGGRAERWRATPRHDHAGEEGKKLEPRGETSHIARISKAQAVAAKQAPRLRRRRRHQPADRRLGSLELAAETAFSTAPMTTPSAP